LPIQYLWADAVPCTYPRASGHPYPRISRHAFREIPMANDVPLSTNQHNHAPTRSRFRCPTHVLSFPPERSNSLTWQSEGNICSVSRSLRHSLYLPACLPTCRFLVLSPGLARCSLARCSSDVALVPKSHQLSFFFALPCSMPCTVLSVLAIYKQQRGREGERGN
jgi:hypothetical protein